MQTITGFDKKHQVAALPDPGPSRGERALAVDGHREMTVVAIENQGCCSSPLKIKKNEIEPYPRWRYILLKGCCAQMFSGFMPVQKDWHMCFSFIRIK